MRKGAKFWLSVYASVLSTAVLAAMLMGAADSSNQPPAPWPRGYAQMTSLSKATSLTIPANSHAALIQAESQNIRLRDDGTSPTASVGLRIMAGDTLWYEGDLRKVELIEEAASAKANVLYYAQH